MGIPEREGTKVCLRSWGPCEKSCTPASCEKGEMGKRKGRKKLPSLLLAEKKTNWNAIDCMLERMGFEEEDNETRYKRRVNCFLRKNEVKKTHLSVISFGAVEKEKRGWRAP